jgi:hypothetical protein
MIFMVHLKWLLVMFFFLLSTHFCVSLFTENRSEGRVASSDQFICKFEGETESGHPFKFNLPESECRWVEYYGSNVIMIQVEYPSMEIVRAKRRVNAKLKDSSIAFWITQVSVDDYQENSTIAGLVPFSVIGGVESYVEGGGFQRFIARDGRSVFAHGVLDVISARRIFDGRFLVQYKYSKRYTDIKLMDEFVLALLEKIITR